jgi:hypothetical protein
MTAEAYFFARFKIISIASLPSALSNFSGRFLELKHHFKVSPSIS